jgi:hypothetical protein
MFQRSARVDIALKSHRNRYVTSLTGVAGWYLAGVAENILGWENLTLLKLSPYEVAIKTAHGYYVSAGHESDNYLLRGRADRILGWEVLKIHYLDRDASEAERIHQQLFGDQDGASGLTEIPVAFTTHNGRWVRCGGVREAFRLVGDCTQRTPECLFKLRLLH